jgi:glutamine synthetase
MYKYVFEYVWIDGDGNTRSKIKIFTSSEIIFEQNIFDLKIIPEWNFDGSSTNQANSNKDTEVILVPQKIYKNPLYNYNIPSYIILCDTYNPDKTPHISNNRYNAFLLFNKNKENEPWYGLEQEYFMLNINDTINKIDGHYYCGNSLGNIQRKIVNEHLDACLYAGLNISGCNAEVSPYQWEFQIGPSKGIDAGDELYVARFLLERIAEKYNVKISYEPKINENINGSGCHCNFSTYEMRQPNGITNIFDAIKKLEINHNNHINVYGKNNDKRLTGLYETSNINTFSYGIGTRNTSIRIPNDVVKKGYGYLEDRRPASNIDPYQVTSIIYNTCCL